MHNALPILVPLWLVFVGCSSPPHSPSSPKTATSKAQVIEALAKLQSRAEAEKSYESWMAEIRPYFSDEAMAHQKMLETIGHIENLSTGLKQRTDQTKDMLLHDLDHEKVLAACRQVMRKRVNYEHIPAIHPPGLQDEPSHIAANNPKLPAIIRELRATYLVAFDDLVRIEFGGGFHHQGLVALAEGKESPSGNAGIYRLIPGLWFYEDTH